MRRMFLKIINLKLKIRMAINIIVMKNNNAKIMGIIIQVINMAIKIVENQDKKTIRF